MNRGIVAILTIAVLLSGCKGKSNNIIPSPTTPPIASTVNVILTSQGAVQPNIVITESGSYNYATNVPGAAITSGTTNNAGQATLSVGNPNAQYCFSTTYTPNNAPGPINVVNCQPTITIGQTITLGN